MQEMTVRIGQVMIVVSCLLFSANIVIAYVSANPWAVLPTMAINFSIVAVWAFVFSSEA